MKDFILATVAEGGLPLMYERRRTVFGNEAEYRWRHRFNSSVECVKIFFNVSDEQDHAIACLLLKTWSDMKVTILFYR